MNSQKNFSNMELGLYSLVVLFNILESCYGAFDNRGTEFIVGFMDNEIFYHSTDYRPEFFITTDKTGPVNVHITALNASNVHLNKWFTITKGQVHHVQVNASIRLHQTEMSPKGILITSSDEIVVYGVNREEYSDDGYLALPTDVLGTEYYTASYSPAYFYTLLMVIGVTDNTQVSIRLANNPGVNVTYNNITYHGGQWINVSMNRLDAFEIHSKGDLTGSYIKASNPVSVLSGNKKTVVGSTGRSRDHLVEHLPPLQSWGKNFATVPIPERSRGDIFRFIASAGNTNVTVTGKIGNSDFHDSFIIKQAGMYVEKHYSSSLYSSITADKPILLMHYSMTQTSTDHGDPSMIMVPPVEQYAADYTFTTPRYSHGNYTNYFMFIIKGSDKAGLQLDGQPLPQNTKYHTIPGTVLEGGYVNISPGTHTVSHTTPTSVIGGILFGKASLESYGFPVGLLLKPINSGCQAVAMTYGDEVDNDCDGNVDEEKCDGIDNDEDGRIDEDCSELETGSIIG